MCVIFKTFIQVAYIILSIIFVKARPPDNLAKEEYQQGIDLSKLEDELIAQIGAVQDEKYLQNILKLSSTTTDYTEAEITTEKLSDFISLGQPNKNSIARPTSKIASSTLDGTVTIPNAALTTSNTATFNTAAIVSNTSPTIPKISKSAEVLVTTNATSSPNAAPTIFNELSFTSNPTPTTPNAVSGDANAAGFNFNAAQTVSNTASATSNTAEHFANGKNHLHHTGNTNLIPVVLYPTPFFHYPIYSYYPLAFYNISPQIFQTAQTLPGVRGSTQSFSSTQQPVLGFPAAASPLPQSVWRMPGVSKAPVLNSHDMPPAYYLNHFFKK